MTKASRITGIFGFLLAGLAAFGVAQAEQVVNAHYEVNVTDGDSRNSVRSTFRTKLGGSERLELYPNVVEFTVLSVSDKEYDLQLIVKPQKQSEAATRAKQTFRGTFGVPLELHLSGDGIEVSGAISVAVLQDSRA